MIFDKHANLKYKYGNRHFWTVGLNEATILNVYAMRRGGDTDIMVDKLSVKEYEDPFKG